MDNRAVQRRILKEGMVWSVALTCGYLSFSAFEPLYDRAKRMAARAGYQHLFDFEATAAGASRFSTHILNAALPLRGTLAAGPPDPPVARKVVLDANDYGHFHAMAQINGQGVEFMTDTGATYVALSYETAQKLGLTPPSLRFNGRSTTANGVARVASITIDSVRIGDITVKDVQAVIAEPGKMAQNLLGMSFIKQLAGFELSGTKLIMTQ